MALVSESIKNFLLDCGFCGIKFNCKEQNTIIHPNVIRKYCHTVIIMESQFNYKKNEKTIL